MNNILKLKYIHKNIIMAFCDIIYALIFFRYSPRTKLTTPRNSIAQVTQLTYGRINQKQHFHL